MNFKSPHFTFDGRSSKEFQLRICRVGNNNDTGIFGLDRSIEEESVTGSIPQFKSLKYNNITMSITLIKTDGFDALPFTEEDKFEIVKWLFQDEYKAFTSEDKPDLTYYVIFTKGSNYENALKQGYITLTMRLNAPYGYSNIISNPLKVSGSDIVELYNKSNVGTYAYPDLEFQVMEGATSVKIENLSTGDVMTFEDLPVGSHVYCYNEDLKQFVMLNNEDYNVRPHYKGDWLRLAYGKNTIRITSDNCHLKIMGQAKVALT